MSDEDLMIHILNNLPYAYELQVEQTEGNMNQDDDPLTLEQFCSTLSLTFERINVSNKDYTDNEEIEKALVTSQFKGHCNNCKKYGHKKHNNRRNGNNDRSNDKSSNKGRFNGTFNYCNKFGHKQADCYKKQSNEQANFN